MNELSKIWWLGYLIGIINGISMRGDVPPDIRKNCEDIVIRYKTELDSILEPDKANGISIRSDVPQPRKEQ